MFTLYKKRDFSAMVSDTIEFFKIYGKPYFKSFIYINGGIMLLMILLFYLLGKIYLESLFGALSGKDPMLVFNSLGDNLPYIISLFIAALVLSIVFSMFTYLFPVGFLKLIEENKELTTKNLWDFIKSNLGRTIIYFIASLFVVMPIVIIILGINIALCLIIIGIPLLFIMIPSLFTLGCLSFYNYSSNKSNGFFSSINVSFKLFFKKPWPIIGNTMAMYFIITTITSLVSYTPYFIAIGDIFSNMDNFKNGQNPFENNSFFLTMMSLTFILSIFFSFISQNVFLINQGIVYYSSQDAISNINEKSEIDSIGLGE